MSAVLWNGVTVEVLTGDIAAQADMSAVVCAANAMLMSGGGVAGAIHRVAGPGLASEGAAYAPLMPGQAVITGGYNLPNQYVIHCLGPVYGVDHPEAQLLADCYRNALLLADEKGIDSVAFPAISTGIFGYPLADATRVALKTVKDVTASLRQVKRIRFVVYDLGAERVYQQGLFELNRNCC